MTGLCSVRREDARGCWRSKRISALMMMMMMRTGGCVVVRGSARKVVRFQACPSFIDVDSDSPVATSENAGLGQLCLPLCLPLCLCLCRCLLLVGLPPARLPRGSSTGPMGGGVHVPRWSPELFFTGVLHFAATRDGTRPAPTGHFVCITAKQTAPLRQPPSPQTGAPIRSTAA